MQVYPNIDLKIRLFHSSAEIWSALSSAEVDVALVVPPVPDEFDHQMISSATVGLILRADTPMAQCAEIPPEMLDGQQIALFPRRIFPTLYDQVVAGLKAFGPWFSDLPESGTECTSSFVRGTGIPVLGRPWWRSEEDRPHDIIYRDILGHKIHLNSVLARSRSRATEAGHLLWRTGEILGAEARNNSAMPTLPKVSPPRRQSEPTSIAIAY